MLTTKTETNINWASSPNGKWVWSDGRMEVGGGGGRLVLFGRLRIGFAPIKKQTTTTTKRRLAA